MLHCRGQGVPRREGPSVILERAVDCVLNGVARTYDKRLVSRFTQSTLSANVCVRDVSGALPPCPVCESEKLTRVEE